MSRPSPMLLALRYWQALGAPCEHIAQRLGTTVEAVTFSMAGLDAEPISVACAGHPSPTPWYRRTAAALIDDGLKSRGNDRLLIVAGDGTLSGTEVRALVHRTAVGLAAAGVGPGRGVAVDATQRLESYLVALATLLLGAPLVRLADIGNAGTLAARLALAPVRVTVSAHAGGIRGNPDAGLALGLDGTASDDFANWLDGCAQPGNLAMVDVGPGDTALIGFTSGSTGQPKCVHTSHEAVFRASEAMQATFNFGRDDIFCTATDFSALSAFRSLVTMPFLSGGTALLPRAIALTAPLALAEDCVTHGVTRLTAVPAVLRGMVAGQSRIAPMPALRMILSGSGILDDTTRASVEAAFGVPVIDYYGGREFATAIYADLDGRATISSAGGYPCNCLIAIVDDGGQVVAPGEVGMIMVHSDCLMQTGLAGDDPQWRGWHATGDLGRCHADGRVQVVGRRRDIIKARDGSLVFPLEIEALLMAMPDIAEAAVIGMTGDDGVEQIVAAVIPAGDPADAVALAHRARAHVLANAGQFRVPSRVLIMAALPRVASNKVDRAALRAQIASTLADPV